MYPTIEDTRIAHQMREEDALLANGRGMRLRRLRTRTAGRPAIGRRP